MAHNQSSTLYIIDQAAFEALYIHHNQYDISGSCPSLKNMAPAFTSLNYDETAQWLTNYAHIYNLKHGDILELGRTRFLVQVYVQAEVAAAVQYVRTRL